MSVSITAVVLIQMSIRYVSSFSGPMDYQLKNKQVNNDSMGNSQLRMALIREIINIPIS